MKIVLVFPRFKYTSGDPPLGLCHLAACVEQQTDAQVDIADASFHQDLDRLIADIRTSQPDIVGVFVDTSMYADARAVLDRVNAMEPRPALTLCGGPHATMLPDSLVDACDAVIVGEGETALCEIVRTFPDVSFDRIPNCVTRKADGTLRNTERASPMDLDALPLPALDKIDIMRYAELWPYLDTLNIGIHGTSLIVSRGCPYNCTYCQPTLRGLFGKRMRQRSPERVVADMEAIRARFGLSAFYFHDDTFTQNAGWVHAFCDCLIEHSHKFLWGVNVRADAADDALLRHMHAAGLRVLHLGIESANQSILDNVYRKGTTLTQVEETIRRAKALDINVLGFFMLGAPGERLEDVRRTIAYAVSSSLDEATFNLTTPLPGTHLHDRLCEDPNIAVSSDFRDYDYYSKQAFHNSLIPPRTLKRLQFLALARFYLTPRRLPYILRHFLSRRGLRKLLAKVERFLRLRHRRVDGERRTTRV